MPELALESAALPTRRTDRARLAARAVRAAGAVLLTLFAMSVVTYGATNLNRGPDAQARAALGIEATSAQVEAFKALHGLDKPLPVRYATWLGDFAHGDWGISPSTDRPVREDALPRIGRTLLLMLAAMLAGVPLAIAIGILRAVRAGSRSDRGVSVLIVVLAAVPEFVVAIGLIMVFGVWLDVLPVDSSGLLFGEASDKVKAYILPAATLALAIAPQIIRLTRAAVREIIPAPYVRAATLRGLARRTIVSTYLVPNAAAPMANVVATNLIYLLGGTIVVEQVFSFPGVGRRLVEAIGQGDTPTVQALAMALAVLTLLISYSTDAIVRLANPRLRRSE